MAASLNWVTMSEPSRLELMSPSCPFERFTINTLPASMTSRRFKRGRRHRSPYIRPSRPVSVPPVRYPSLPSGIRTGHFGNTDDYCPNISRRWAQGGTAYAVGYVSCTSPASWPPLPSPFQPSHTSGVPAPPQHLYLRPIGAEIHKTQPCTRSYSSTWRPSSPSPSDAALPAIPRSSSASFDAIWTVAF